MSLGEADAKFPGQGGSALPPSPTRENPGQVYPKSSPEPANAQVIPGTGRTASNPRTLFSNPFAFNEYLIHLENALDSVIVAISKEEQLGSSGSEVALLKKFKNWRSELDLIRESMGASEPRSKVEPEAAQGNISEGGLFTE